MNEWSPGGTYPRPVTPNAQQQQQPQQQQQQHQMRTFRSHWDDQNIDKASNKALIVNVRGAADTRSKATFQQRSQEDISKTSLSACNRLKKSVNGSSDPRFKRVISSGAQNDACVGTEVKITKPLSAEMGERTVLNLQDWNLSDAKSRQPWGDANQTNKDSLKNQMCSGVGVGVGGGGGGGGGGVGTIATADSCGAAPQEPPKYESVQEHLRDVDKFSFNHEIVANNFPKQSASDCTINTRNTSLVSEDLGDDYAERLQTFSSTTRVKKVQNWIADQKPKLDKRQSVITVIGQTQGQSGLSSAFQEIDQRRKLVKELDKYAICNKITESEKDKEMNTLVAQINFLSPSGKVLYSGDKKYDLKNLPAKLRPANAKYSDVGEKLSKQLDLKQLDFDDQIQCDNELATEHDTSLSPSSRHSSNHNQKKSYLTWEDKYDIKGKLRQALCRIPYAWLAYFMLFISGTLCWYTYLVFQRSGTFPFDLFPQKPKTTTWYEKLCYWIWEIFRPSGNYQRSSSWGSR